MIYLSTQDRKKAEAYGKQYDELKRKQQLALENKAQEKAKQVAAQLEAGDAGGEGEEKTTVKGKGGQKKG